MTPLTEEYKDIEYLERVGHWKNGVPDWARDKAEFYRCSPADRAVLEFAKEKELIARGELIGRLRLRLRCLLRNQFLEYESENGELRTRCMECFSSWLINAPEEHGLGCLAAKEEEA